MRSTKFWVLLIGAVLALCAVYSATLIRGRPGDATAVIYQDGEPVQTIDLYQVDEPWSFTLEWEGGYNVICVEHGRIRVSEADCPDQICVRQGWISDGAIPIACLPHHLAIRLTSSGGSAVDGAAG